jgi:hypothetical protein
MKYPTWMTRRTTDATPQPSSAVLFTALASSSAASEQAAAANHNEVCRQLEELRGTSVVLLEQARHMMEMLESIKAAQPAH